MMTSINLITFGLLVGQVGSCIKLRLYQNKTSSHGWTLWQLHMPPPTEIIHPHYEMTRLNKHHQFDLLYVSNNIFEGNTYKYVLTSFDVASRCKVARAGMTKKVCEVAFVFEAIFKK